MRAKQVYWAERQHDAEPLRFRQYLEPKAGEQVVLVDDILRTGAQLTELRRCWNRVAPPWWGWR